MTQKKRYKRYSPEFKREALLRTSEEGIADKQVCEELDPQWAHARHWPGASKTLRGRADGCGAPARESNRDRRPAANAAVERDGPPEAAAAS